MIKRIIPLLLIIPLTLISCSKSESPTESSKDNNTTLNNQVSLGTPPMDRLSFTNSTITTTSYLELGNLLFFKDSNNNDKISTMESMKNSIINQASIIESYNYPINSIISINNDIYFSSHTDYSIYKLDYQKSEISQISTTGGNSLTTNNELIFFIHPQTSNLYSLNPNTKESKLLVSDKCGKYIINNNIILFQNISDKNKLYSISIDGSNLQQLTDTGVDSFSPYGNTEILFINTEDNNNLYSLNSIDLKTKRLANINGVNLCVSNEIIYFQDETSKNLISLKIDSTTKEQTFNTIFDQFINNYYISNNKIFAEFASSPKQTYILSLD